MRKIGFIGAFDKFDFVLYVAKILTALGKKVLVIDATINQKARYVVPALNPTVRYITELEEIDVAVGYEDMYSIEEELGQKQEHGLEYDYLLLDIDSDYSFDNFDMAAADKIYFVTSFDTYSIKRGLQIFSVLKAKMPVTKILYEKDVLIEDDEYLNYLSKESLIEWEENKIYVPFEEGDQTAIIENQRVAKIKFRKLTQGYKEALEFVTEELTNDISPSNIKKAMRNIEKGVL